MQGQIDVNMRPMTQNPTPKRNRQYRQRIIEGGNIQRTQEALRALADAHERGAVPIMLKDLKSKAQVAPLVRKRLESTGYYEVHEGDYADCSPIAQAIRELVVSVRSPEAAKVFAEQAHAQWIAELEDKVRRMSIRGFFPTPKLLIDKMLVAADLRPGDKVLEPSAGKGDIADAMKAQGVIPDVIEICGALWPILKAKGYTLVATDFLRHQGEDVEGGGYDKIVMNPPFEKGQDIDHVRHAYSLLKPDGRLVAIMSEGSFYRSDRKATEFRDWLADVGGESDKNPSDAFKGPGAFCPTSVATRMVTIQR